MRKFIFLFLCSIIFCAANVMSQTTMQCVIDSDFEAGAATVAYGSGWNSWADGTTREWADGEGYGGSGALAFTNPAVAANAWSVQFRYELAEPVMVGETYYLTLMARTSADAEGSIGMLMQNPSNQWCGVFGENIELTEEWQLLKLETTITGENAGHLIFNVGKFAGTLFIDNVSLCYAVVPVVYECVIDTDFEFENGQLPYTAGAGWNSWGNSSSRALTADGEGYGGEGYALKFTNPTVGAETHTAQLEYRLANGFEVGLEVFLTFWVKGDVAGSASVQMQNPTGYVGCGSFGSFNITEGWTKVELSTTITNPDGIQLIFNVGKYAGTVLMDDLSLCYVAEPIEYECVIDTDFEFENGQLPYTAGAGWNSWGNSSSRALTADGEGFGGEGYALKFTNPTVGAETHTAQLEYRLANGFEVGLEVFLTFWVKGDVAGSASVQMQNPTGYVGCGSFGSFNITEGWTKVELSTTITNPDGIQLIFNVGKYAGTVLMDDLNLCYVKTDFVPPVINITTQPAANTVFIEGEITGNLTVAATATLGAEITYQWFETENIAEDGEAIEGKTSATFAIPTGLTVGTYYYYCVVSAEGATSVTSNVSTVVVRTVSHGDIEVHPVANTNVIKGYISGELSVEVIAVDGGGELSYQWFINTTPRNIGGTEIESATEATLSIPAGLEKGSHYFYCVVSVDGEKVSVSNTGKVVVLSGFMIADFEDDNVGDTYPIFINSGTVGGIAEVELSPHDNSTGYPDPNAGTGKALHIHGTQNNGEWGLTGNQNFPEFDVQLPEGKTLGDYEYFIIDAYFYRGKDAGGTSDDGAGWYGWGAPGLRIFDGENEAVLENFAGNMKVMGTITLNEQGLQGDWQPRTWARGIKFALSNNSALSESFKSLTDFKIRFGSRSGAVNYVLDNVALIESRVVTSYDFENYALGDRLPMWRTLDDNGNAEGSAEQHAKNIAEVVEDPDVEDNSGQALLLYGTNWHAEYGYTGVRGAPEFVFVLPAGKTLGDYASLQLDLRFTAGTDNCDPEVPGKCGTNSAGSGWAGSGTVINIDGGFTNAEGAPTTAQHTYSSAQSLGNAVTNATLGRNWQTQEWARGITIPLLNMNLSSEYKALTEFTLRVGTRSGAHRYWMDNVTLVESTAEHGEIINQPTETTNVTQTKINGELSVTVNVGEGGPITYQWYENTTASNENGTAISGETDASFEIPKDLGPGKYYYYCVVSVGEEVSDVSNVATVEVAEYSDCIFTDDFESYAIMSFTYDLKTHKGYNDLIKGLTDNIDQMTYFQFGVQNSKLSDLELAYARLLIPDPETDVVKEISLEGEYTWVNNATQKGWNLFSDDEEINPNREAILEGLADGTITGFVIAFTAHSIEANGGTAGIGSTDIIFNSTGGGVATGWSVDALVSEMDLEERTPGMKSSTEGWNSWSNATQVRSLSAAGKGFGGTGYALVYTTTEKRTNDYDHQLSYELPMALPAGEDFEWSFWVRAELAANSETTVNGNVQNPTGYGNDGDFSTFELTSEWQLVKSKVTIKSTTAARHRPLFNFGHVVGVTYFDDVKFCYSGPIVRITTQPVENITVGQGSIVEKLTVVATITQSANISYQWYSNTTASNKGGTLIAGATGAEFAIPEALTAANGPYYYYCVVGGSEVDNRETDAVTSRVTAVEVLAEGVPLIAITEQPVGGTFFGTGTTLTVAAEETTSYGAALSYQWYQNTTAGNTGGTAISGATSTEYTVPAKVGTYYFYCIVNAHGEQADAAPKTSNVATVVVQALIEIATQPVGATVAKGSSANLTVVATVTDGATLTYQWYLSTTNTNTGGTTLTGATNASYSTNSMLDAGTYYYYCIVNANYGAASVTSDIATVVIGGGSAVTNAPEIMGANLKVYPNPFTGTIRIEGVEGATLYVVNSAGTTVAVQKITNDNEIVNLEYLPAGLYVLRLEKDKQATAVTVIKN